MSKIRLGKYQHFKGEFCEVVGVAKHSESLEEMVVYRHLRGLKGKYRKNSLWVRPREMFLEKVERDGKKIPRFRYIGK